MEVSIDLLAGPLGRISVMMLRASRANSDFKTFLAELKTITPVIKRLERKEDLSSLEYEEIHAPRLRALAENYKDLLPLTVNVQNNKAILEAGEEWAIILNAILETMDMSAEELRAAERWSGFMNTDILGPSEQDIFNCYDISQSNQALLEYWETPEDLFNDLTILKIPYQTVERTLIIKSKLKSISKEGIVISNTETLKRQSWTHLRERFPSPGGIFREIDSLLND